MTDQELKDLVASLAVQSKETERAFKESKLESDRMLKELGQQIGGLNNKFGTYTEGLSGASIRRILEQRFGCDGVTYATKRQRKSAGLKAEIDYLGSVNGGDNRIIVVEVKIHLREEHLQQMEKILSNFTILFPEYRGYTVEGMFALVSAEEGLEEEVLKQGYHLARGADRIFELADPPDFVPKRLKV